jgi:hypothetical protein
MYVTLRESCQEKKIDVEGPSSGLMNLHRFEKESEQPCGDGRRENSLDRKADSLISRAKLEDLPVMKVLRSTRTVRASADPLGAISHPEKEDCIGRAVSHSKDVERT